MKTEEQQATPQLQKSKSAYLIHRLFRKFRVPEDVIACMPHRRAVSEGEFRKERFPGAADDISILHFHQGSLRGRLEILCSDSGIMYYSMCQMVHPIHSSDSFIRAYAKESKRSDDPLYSEAAHEKIIHN